MIFLRVLPKIFLWPHYSGAPGARGPGSLNHLNPRFLRHWEQDTSTQLNNVGKHADESTNLPAKH